MLSDEELYEGFARDEVEGIKAEAKLRWGGTDAYAESQKRVGRMSKATWARVRAEGEAVDAAMAAALAAGEDPSSASVQALMARKFEHLRAFYEPTMQMFAGLGKMYTDDERFKAHYEAIALGLADYMRRAMAAYAAS